MGERRILDASLLNIRRSITQTSPAHRFMGRQMGESGLILKLKMLVITRFSASKRGSCHAQYMSDSSGHNDSGNAGRRPSWCVSAARATGQCSVRRPRCNFRPRLRRETQQRRKPTAPSPGCGGRQGGGHHHELLRARFPTRPTVRLPCGFRER